MRSFEEGLELYVQGDWAGARAQLARSAQFKGEDGPLKALLSEMEGHGFQAPVEWMGYREM